MRIVVLLLAILGALAAGGASAVWFMQGIQEVTTQESRLNPGNRPDLKAEARAILPMLVTEPYVLGAGCLLGLLAALLAICYCGKSACVLLMLAGAGPLALAAPNIEWLRTKPDWLITMAAPCAVLLIGGLLALLIRPKPALALEGGPDEDEDEPEED